MKVLKIWALFAVIACNVSAIESWDASGNGLLKGTYYFRHVTYATYVEGGARVIYGLITFDGEEEYKMTGWVFAPSLDSVPNVFAATGSYAIASSGLGSLMNPIDIEDEIIGLATGAGFVGSSTEGGASDIFIAVPTAGAVPSLEGKFWLAHFQMLNNDRRFIRNSLLSITADGRGGLGNVTARGFASNLGDQVQTQEILQAGYSIAADGTGTLRLPAGQAAPEANLISGDKEFAVSANGDILLGGSRSGLDLIVGVRALTSSASNSTFGGFYSMAGVELDMSAPDNQMHKYYGTATVDGEGHALWYERDSEDNLSWDFTFESPYSVAADGTIDRPLYRYAIGMNGQALLSIGNAPQYAIRLILRAPLFSGSGVFLDPAGIVNAASYASFATGVSPGELISLFGANLSPSSALAQSLPLPKSLVGVSVLMGGLEAPLYRVSPTEIVAIVPYQLGPLPESTVIQVINNGRGSNQVTTFFNTATPGVFTVPPTGLGSAAALHADYTPVITAHPAQRGETILVYMTGLGYVNPQSEAGNAGPAFPLAVTKYAFRAYIGGSQASVAFTGLAPGLAGLYQMNVVVPDAAPSGPNVSLEVEGGGSRTMQAEIPIRQ